MNNNNLISKLQLLFYVCIENNIPILGRDGFLLGTIRHNGFMNYDIDPDIMICETDKNKLDSLKKVSNNFFTVKYHKKYDDVFYIYNDNQVIGEGVILVHNKDNNMLQQGKNFYGGEREKKRFYSVYGHSESEDAVYKYSFNDVYPLSKCLFYEKEIFVPKNSIKLLKEHYGDDVMTHYFDKLEKNIIKNH